MSIYDIEGKQAFTNEQVEAIDFALKKFNCILGLKAGMGKTRVSIRIAMEFLSRRPDYTCLIFCPREANSAFQRELQYFDQPYSIYTTNEYSTKPDAKFLIFNFSNLKLLEDTINTKKLFAIIDEIHYCKDPKTNVYKALKYIRPSLACVIGLTGTPLLNSLDTLWYIVDLVSPNFLGSYRQFCNNFIIKKKRSFKIKGRSSSINEVVGFKHLDVLNQRLKELCFVRGKSYDIQYFSRITELSNKEIPAYNEATKGVFNSEYQKDYSGRLHDLQRVVDGVYQEDAAKPKLLIQTLSEILSRNEGCLVYTEYEDSYTFLYNTISQYKDLLGYRELWMITGKTDYEDRLECEKRLSAKDIVILTKAGSTSINLQAVNNVVFYDIPFAIQTCIQAIGRVTRVDTKYPKQNIYFLLVKDTIDEYKYLLVKTHLNVINQVLGVDDNMLTVSPDFDMLKFRDHLKRKLLWSAKKVNKDEGSLSLF